MRQIQVTYNHGSIVNIYIVYETTRDTKNSNITLENCLFGGIKLIKNFDIDKYKYSGYGIEFDSGGSFHNQLEEMAQMLLFLELIEVILCMLITK